MKQTLSTAADGHWYKLPGRPLPVPDNWLSVDKNQYVLSFTNAGLPQISTRWVTGGQLSFPAGMNQIGPEGGMVELPGVAIFKIPPGAIEVPTVIKLSQVRKAPFRTGPQSIANNDEFIPNNLIYDYASAIIKIEPFRTKLEKPGNLTVSLLKNIYSRVTPGFVSELMTPNINDFMFGMRPLWGNDGILTPITVDEFLFCGKLIEFGWLKNNGSENFSTQQVSSTPTPVPTPSHNLETPYFFVDKEDPNTPDFEVQKVGDILDYVYKDFLRLGFLVTDIYKDDLKPVVLIGKGANPTGSPPSFWEVAELVKPVEVTAYRRFRALCPACGERNVAPWPEQVIPGQSIGPKLNAWLVYLHTLHNQSFAKLEHLCEDLLGLPMS